MPKARSKRSTTLSIINNDNTRVDVEARFLEFLPPFAIVAAATKDFFDFLSPLV